MNRATCAMAWAASGGSHRRDPRVGTDSVMRLSQHKMVTFVNGNVARAG